MPHYHTRQQAATGVTCCVQTNTPDSETRNKPAKKDKRERGICLKYTHFVGDGDGRVVVDGGHDQFVDRLELFGRLLLDEGGRLVLHHRRPVVGRRQRGRHRRQHQGGHGREHPAAVGALLLLRLLVVQLLLLEVVERRLEDVGGQSGCCCCWAHWVIHFADEGSRVG